MTANKPATWICRDGRTVRVSDMGDQHLRNTIAMLRRNVEVYRLSILRKMGTYLANAPDGAYDCCSAEADNLIEADDDEALSYCIPQYNALIKEARKRALL